MRNLRVYESWSNSDGVEDLRDLLGYHMDYIRDYFKSKQMESDFVEVSSPDEFVLEYWPESYDSRIPKKISYYLDEITSKLSEMMKVPLDWNFSPNGNVQRIEFSLDGEIDQEHLATLRKLANTRERLRYT
jgi:hypothetical protein